MSNEKLKYSFVGLLNENLNGFMNILLSNLKDVNENLSQNIVILLRVIFETQPGLASYIMYFILFSEKLVLSGNTNNPDNLSNIIINLFETNELIDTLPTLYLQLTSFIYTLYDKPTGTNLISILRNDRRFWKGLLLPLTKTEKLVSTQNIDINMELQNLDPIPNDESLLIENEMTKIAYQISSISIILNIVAHELYLKYIM